MEAFRWICPFCNHHQMVTEQNYQSSYSRLYIGVTKHGATGFSHTAIRCVNEDCNEVTISTKLALAERGYGGTEIPGETLGSWRLRPESSSKVQPDYIPSPLREDYYEACLIRDNSPKAAATLARRCLQGMIRDFCGIAKATLFDEIKELRDQLDAGHAPKGVEAETIDAIDAIRGVGNIGAHMEKDINIIIDVDPGEAQVLIELIEMLFDEWYVARHKREQRLAAVQAIAAQKKAEIQAGKAQKAQAIAVATANPGQTTP